MKLYRSLGLLVALTAVLATVLVLEVPSAQAQSGDRYAAIAYSTSTGRYGYSFNYGSRYEAESRALSECGTGDARIVAWVRNGWCALAKGDRISSYGWGWSNISEEDARNRALNGYPASGAYIAVSVFSGQ